MNAILASKRATQTSWQRTFQAQAMNSARRATELALILINAARSGAPLARRQRRAQPWEARPPHAGPHW